MHYLYFYGIEVLTINNILTKKVLFKLDNKNLIKIYYSFFLAWFFAIVYNENVTNTIKQAIFLEKDNSIFLNIYVYIASLILSGFLIKNHKTARYSILCVTTICFIASFGIFSNLFIKISILIISLLSGIAVTSFGYLFKNYCHRKDRFKMTIDILIIANLAQIPIAISIETLHIYFAFAISLIYLVISILSAFKIDIENTTNIDNTSKPEVKILSKKSIIFLYIFIIIANMSVGLTYQTIGPVFSKFYFLDSFYGFLIYVIGLFIIKITAKNLNHYYTFYWAIGMIGVSFIFFIVFEDSLLSYLFVNTFINLSSAVLDVFCRSSISELLSFSKKPASFFGIGMSANILGIFIGEILGGPINNSSDPEETLISISIIVVLLILILFPLLNKNLSHLFKYNVFFLKNTNEVPVSDSSKSIEKLFLKYNLTNRESQIALILSTNTDTYKNIAKNLCISENTVKTHIKNIYSKLNVSSRAEFMKLISEYKTNNPIE